MSSSTMHAVVQSQPGGPETLSLGVVVRPVPKAGEIMIQVTRTALNRADTLQRKGAYPPPPGASTILGLEVVGTVASFGPDCKGDFKVGERVMALLGGGGYAQYVCVLESHVMRVPTGVTDTQAAAIPECWLTAYQLSIMIGQMRQNEYVLIHAGASSVGVALIQLARAVGAIPIVTCSGPKVSHCLQSGAAAAIDYRAGPFHEGVLKFIAEDKTSTDQGVGLVLDPVGASHAVSNLHCLQKDARWVFYGTMGGGYVSDFPLRLILAKRIQLTGSTLRTRSDAYKTNLISEFSKFVLEPWKQKGFSVVIDTVLELPEVARAHAMMDGNLNKGKIVLTVQSEYTNTKRICA